MLQFCFELFLHHRDYTLLYHRYLSHKHRFRIISSWTKISNISDSGDMWKFGVILSRYLLVPIMSGKQSVLSCWPTHQTDWITGMLEFWCMLPAFHSLRYIYHLYLFILEFFCLLKQFCLHLEHGFPTCSPPDCIMRAMAIFINYVYTIKITQ